MFTCIAVLLSRTQLTGAPVVLWIEHCTATSRSWVQSRQGEFG